MMRLRTWTAAVVVLSLLWLASTVSGQDAAGRRLAVVFGVEYYRFGFRNLSSAAKDARAFAGVLDDLGGAVTARYASAATGDGVDLVDAVKVLTNVLAKAEPDDTVIVYFAGHGSRRDGEEYLLFTDTDSDRVRQTALRVFGEPEGADRPTLQSLLRTCKARRRVLVLDVCRTTRVPGAADKRAGFEGSALDSRFRTRLDEVVRSAPTVAEEALIRSAILWACEPGQASYEGDAGGVFTQALVQALRRGERTAGRLVAAAQAGVPAELRERQRPVLGGNDGSLSLAGDIGVPPVRRQAGETRVNAKDSAVLVWVPAGEFDMGSNDGEDDEKPVHRVELTRGFWLYQTEVTNAMYRKFVAATGHREPRGLAYVGNEVKEIAIWDDARFNQAQQPVVGVSYDDAVKYMRWAGGRLPTEAQWEYAARGPQRRKYPWGDGEPTASLAVFNLPVAKGSAAVVGSKRAGASWCGGLDLAGNVWEWCNDYYDADYYQKSPRQDPENTQQAQYLVLRGGTWFLTAAFLRGAYRNYSTPVVRLSGYGFRGVSAAPED